VDGWDGAIVAILFLFLPHKWVGEPGGILIIEHLFFRVNSHFFDLTVIKKVTALGAP
jgi:hypothetical protein